jgi:hypothetical protein
VRLGGPGDSSTHGAGCQASSSEELYVLSGFATANAIMIYIHIAFAAGKAVQRQFNKSRQDARRPRRKKLFRSFWLRHGECDYIYIAFAARKAVQRQVNAPRQDARRPRRKRLFCSFWLRHSECDYSRLTRFNGELNFIIIIVVDRAQY